MPASPSWVTSTIVAALVALGLAGGISFAIMGVRSGTLGAGTSRVAAQNPTPILPTPVPLDPSTPTATATAWWGTRRAQIQLPLALRDGAASAVTPAGKRLGSARLGVSLPWNDGVWSDGHLEAELDHIDALGVTSLRVPVRWRDIEPEAGDFRWATTDARLRVLARRGYELHVVVVDYPAWASRYRCGGGLLEGGDDAWVRLMSAAAKRYRGQVAIWELGNEPDGESTVEADDAERRPERGRDQPTEPERGCWGELAKEYAQFVTLGAHAVRAASPQALVVPGTMSIESLPLDHDPQFLATFLGHGGEEAVDAIAYRWEPQAGDGVEEAGHIERILGNARVELPLWLTETGQYTERDPRFVADSYATQFHTVTQDLVRLASTAGLRRMYWHGWRDPEEHEDDEGWATDPGLVTAAGDPKPAWHALRHVLEHAADRSVRIASRPGSEAFRFRGVRDETWIAWSTTGDKGYVSFAVPPGADPSEPIDKVYFEPGAEPALPWEPVLRRIVARDGRYRVVLEPAVTFVHSLRAP